MNSTTLKQITDMLAKVCAERDAAAWLFNREDLTLKCTEPSGGGRLSYTVHLVETNAIVGHSYDSPFEAIERSQLQVKKVWR